MYPMPQSKDQERSKGVEPDAVKVASPVLNGEVEETDRQVLRLDLTQLGATVAAASGGVSKQWWWEAAREGGLRWRRASAWPASRASPGLRGPLGCHQSPLC